MSRETSPPTGTAFPDRAVSLDTMQFNHTGSWRYLGPISSERLAPCRRNCPAGTDIPRMLSLASHGRMEEAFSLILENNPLPAVCGRVCYHPCEGSCTRAHLDEGIAIQAVERRVSEVGLQIGFDGPASPARSERVAVVGSGPAGLSCAWFLASKGIQVRVFEAEDEVGGMLRVGIPPYRLPRAILDHELARIENLGVELVTGCRIGRDLPFEVLRRDFDALFVAAGAHRSRIPPLTVDKGPVLSGLDFLRSFNLGNPPQLRRDVLIIGGGNTALDAARTALRLGARPLVVYRRSRREMPAHPEEIEAAASEGVQFLFLVSPLQVITGGEGGIQVELIQMELGAQDESGRARPIPVEGSNFRRRADMLILAVGEEADIEFASSGHGVFFGGDSVSGPSTVVNAIASGREGAADILRFLGISPDRGDFPMLPDRDFLMDSFNPAYFEAARRVVSAHLPLRDRVSNFQEIIVTLSADQARSEASRCVSCGVCNQCDNCWVFCPENAIRRRNGQYAIDLDYCKGCGICARECPRGVITLAGEQL